MISKFTRFIRHPMGFEMSRRSANEALIGTQFKSDKAWVGPGPSLPNAFP
jgi:hypothetical protein